MKKLKAKVGQIVKQLPIISDYYRYHWSFSRTVTACRGVYPTFSAAVADVPTGAKAGYNQPNLRHHPDLAKLTTASAVDEFNPTDYPVLVWLAAAFANSTKVFDLGGNLGHGYYSYQKFLQYPPNLQWLVCDIPEIIAAGAELAKRGNHPGLSFTPDLGAMEGMEILITSGTLQYIESSLAEMLGKLQTKPRHLTINRVPFYEGETFITLQNIGYAVCPYKIQNRQKFIESLQALGYKLIDSWVWDRTCVIPFHPERFIPSYCGFYLQLV